MPGQVASAVNPWFPQNDAVRAMGVAMMSAGSVAGGYMRDSVRVRRIYAVAGTTPDQAGAPADWMDSGLSGGWRILFGIVPIVGDGAVTRTSAFGVFADSGSLGPTSWVAGTRILGPFTPWLEVPLNHSHSRLNDVITGVQDHINGTTVFR